MNIEAFRGTLGGVSLCWTQRALFRKLVASFEVRLSAELTTASCPFVPRYRRLLARTGATSAGAAEAARWAQRH